MREALDQALAAGDRALACMLRIRLGEIANGFDAAEQYYRAALADAEARHDTYLATWALGDLGLNRGRVTRYDEAIPLLERERQAAEQLHAKSFIALSNGNLGWCYWRLGDLDRAMGRLTIAEDLSRQIGFRDAQHRWLGAIGNIYMERGDLVRAAAYQQRAEAIARDVGNDTWVAIAMGNLADIALKKGDLPAARSFNDQAMVIYQRLGNRSSMVYSEVIGAGIDAKDGKYAAAETGYRTAIREAAQTFLPDVLWQAYGDLAALYQETHRTKQAEEAYQKAIDTINREWNKLSSDDSRATFLAPSYLIGFFQDYVSFLIQNHQPARALEMAESSRARVLAQKLQQAGAVGGDFRIDRLIAEVRASHTVILSYWLAPEHSSVWAIGRGGVSHYALPSADRIARLVRQYTNIVTQGGDPLAQGGALPTDLYNAVIGPVAHDVPPGSNVIVVPDGALHELNFETLIVPRPQPHYWIEDVAVATAPSLRVLASGHRGRGPRKLLLLGDPVLLGQEFGPLPRVRQEIAAVEERFPSAGEVAFTGARAVPGAYLAAGPASFTNIHFATHATANFESPLNSAIILSHQGESFKLYARDVAAVPLTADLVTISACHSAGAKAYAGEGLMGFAWAFLQAGAQNVIASLWDVDDAHLPDIMRCLYGDLAKGESPQRALRSAKLALLHSGSSARLPYYWGPLQVFTRRIDTAK